MADLETLRMLAIGIRDEKKVGANTAWRVGNVLEKLVEALEAKKDLKHYHESDEQVGISITDDKGNFAKLVINEQGIFLQRISDNAVQDITMSDYGVSVASDVPIDLSASTIKIATDIPDLLKHIKNITPTADGGLYVGEGGLRVKVGAGLTIADCSVAVKCGSGLDINSCGGLYVTVGGGTTYASGDGIDISGGKIAVKYCDGLQITNGHLTIATGDGLHCNNGGKLAINPSFGLGFTTDGMLKLKLHEKSGLQATSDGLGVNAGIALSTNDGKLNVQYGTGLGKSTDNKLQVLLGTGLAVEGNYGTGMSENNNKIYVDTSKIAGAGIDLDSAYKTLTIGTKAAKELAGTGLVADGPKMKVKYGSGLTTNTCGGLIVDAGKLTVGNATNATYLDGLHAAYYTPRDRNVDGKDMNTQKESAVYMGYNMKNSAATEISSFLLCRYSDDWGAQMQFSLVSGKVHVRFWQDTGGIMGTWKELAYTSGIVARATADANGNKITETYARRFMPTNGLEINSDRELFLPNLTASVVNGAVDGSKNGAQRVLNLNCGVIQIKLSTGLAIDDNGYLYIQDKYVTK